MSRLVEFYQGTGLDTEGRSLAEMWAFSDKEREDCHLWTIPNHNWLRITRVLHCLRTLGLQERARQIDSCLDDLNGRGEIRISPSTLAYWKDATYRT